MEKFEPYKKPVRCCSTLARSLASSEYHPVVPTTMFAPPATQASMLSSTQWGVVKSTTTSIGASLSLDSPDAFAFSTERSVLTSCPRSWATCATRDPVFPQPSKRILMESQCNLSGQRCAGPDRECEWS